MEPRSLERGELIVGRYVTDCLESLQWSRAR